MLKLNQVAKSVETQSGLLNILAAIELEIKPAETLAIVGSSGSGKSTLLGMMAGLDLPSQGSILLQGQDLTQLDEEARAALRAQYVGFVFQSFQLLPGLTALENVMLPLELRGDADAKAQAAEYLKRVGLGERVDHQPRQLSGGEQQRVAIARAFACKPSILFADEPTGNLDSQTGDSITELLFELNAQEGTTLVLVTHSPALANRCQRQVELCAGRIVFDSAQETA